MLLLLDRRLALTLTLTLTLTLPLTLTQGRPNKDEDTCYSFWIGASLELVGAGELRKTQPKTQPSAFTPGYPPLHPTWRQTADDLMSEGC